MRHRQIVATLGMALLLGACGGGSSEAGRTLPTVTGTVGFDQRVAVPPDATLVVRLVDASNVNQKAQTVASTTVSQLGRPPIAFAIEYEKSRIDSGGGRFARSLPPTVDGCQSHAVSGHRRCRARGQ